MKKGCCRYDESFYKMNDSHQSESVAITPTPFSVVCEVISHHAICNITFTNSDTKVHCCNGSPPLSTSTEIYLLNCNFRI